MAIRAITFDFWRTLFHEAADPVARRAIRSTALARVAGVSEEEASEAMRVAETEFLQHHIHQQRTLGPADAVRIASAHLGKSVDPEDQAYLAEVFGSAILHYPPLPIDGALEAVRAAADRYPVGIISDAGLSPGKSLRTLLERNHFLPYFKCTIFSDEVGVAKPQRLMYETAALRLGVQVDELFHIGDLEGTDIVGAKAVGAKSALFAGDNTRYLDSNSADYRFRSWEEFVALLPGLG